MMEEEYRMQKAQSEILTVASDLAVNGGAVIHEDGTVTHPVNLKKTSTVEDKDNEVDDDASTRGVHENLGDSESPTSSSVEEVAAGIPTIRISTESNREKEKQANGDEGAKQNEMTEVPGSTLEKPVQAAAGEDKEAGGTQETSTPNTAQEPFSFSNKRLCERWLDNLFMVLYEVNISKCYDSSTHC